MATRSIKEIIETLEGCEVQSLSQAGVVGVTKGEFFMDGNKLTLAEDEIDTLWSEYLYQEGVTDIAGNIIAC